MKELSDEAKRTLKAIGEGKLLRIGRDNCGPRLIDPPRRPQGYGQVPVSSRAVFELMQADMIRRLPRTRTRDVAGLEDDMGITDADQAEYWACKQ